MVCGTIQGCTTDKNYYYINVVCIGNRMDLRAIKE